MSDCPFLDPYCPCQDGDACHYRDISGSPAITPPFVFWLGRDYLYKIEANGMTDTTREQEGG